jgi:hypothetical protein
MSGNGREPGERADSYEIRRAIGGLLSLIQDSGYMRGMKVNAVRLKIPSPL